MTGAWAIGPVLAAALLAGCGALPSGPGLNRPAGGVFAPGVARGEGEDPLIVAHRLMDAGEYELALDSYGRAVAGGAPTVDALAGMGSANLRLGRLGQAERYLRAAVAEDALFAPAWNNLGVLLMEQGKAGEASEAFRRAYAADSGASDTIRDNLRAALARLDDPAYTGVNEAEEVRLIGLGVESRPLPAGPGEPL